MALKCFIGFSLLVPKVNMVVIQLTPQYKCPRRTLRPPIYGPALHCTELQYVMYRSALHCTTLHCFMYSAALLYVLLRYTAMSCFIYIAALLYVLLHYTELYCVMYSPALLDVLPPALHCTNLCTELHCKRY